MHRGSQWCLVATRSWIYVHGALQGRAKTRRGARASTRRHLSFQRRPVWEPANGSLSFVGERTAVSREVEAIHQGTMKRGSVLSGAGQASALLPGVPSHGSVLGKRREKVIDMWVLVYPISKELLSMNTPAHHTCPDEGMMAKRSRLKMTENTVPLPPPKKHKNVYFLNNHCYPENPMGWWVVTHFSEIRRLFLIYFSICHF